MWCRVLRSNCYRTKSLNTTYHRSYTSTMPLLSSTTSSHYQAHSAESYEEAYFYEPGEYQHYLVKLLRGRLQLDGTSARHILDIGGGTGNFAHALLQQELEVEPDLQHHITVVDPFLDPTQQVSSSQVSFVKESAEVFCNQEIGKSWRNNVHQILLKEVVHHLEDRVKIFRGMHQDLTSLPDAPSLLIVTRPQKEIDYPLWDAAREVWMKNQPSSEELCQELQQAGFNHIQQTLESYPCQVSLKRWNSMIQGRFWSTFSNFTDEELQLACDNMAHQQAGRIDENGTLHFQDRLVLISARKG